MKPLSPNPPHDERQLEHFVHAELRRLPSLQAPDDLIQRVRARLEARQHLPWWQQSFWHWPSWVRTLALVLLTTLSAATIAGGPLLVGDWLETALTTSPLLPWLPSVQLWLGKAWSWIALVANSMWIWVGAALGGAVYAMVVGLGMALFRLTSAPSARPRASIL